MLAQGSVFPEHIGQACTPRLCLSHRCLDIQLQHDSVHSTPILSKNNTILTPAREFCQKF